MIMSVKRIVINVLSVIPLFFLICAGCSFHPPNKVVIDRQFLYEIEKEFEEEAKHKESRRDAYNELWEENYDELIYLTTIGDRKAIDVSISLIGQKEESTHLSERIEFLIKPVFESDPDYFWEAIEKKEYDTQIKVLHIFDFFKPLDWSMEEYLDKHPEIKKLYENEFGTLGCDLNESDITGTWVVTNKSRQYFLPPAQQKAPARIVMNPSGSFVVSDIPEGMLDPYRPTEAANRLLTGRGDWKLVSAGDIQNILLDFNAIISGQCDRGPYLWELNVSCDGSVVSLFYFWDAPDQRLKVEFKKE